ncbi:type I polyketide synthase, partial [Actinosynnema sp. NPDC059797]
PARPEDDGLLGGFLTDLAGFDAAFFGLSPNEALRMDPRQRLALEVAWAALEHAGLAADGLRGGRTGVFLGMMSDGQYAATQTEADPGSPDDPHFGTGIAPSVLAGRLSYLLDLRGPSLTVDTACSSSLVAVHLAAESLRRGECDVAVAGGVSAVVHPTAVRQALRMNMLAADGRCKAFDADADGFLIGEGCGVVVLQRLGDARRRRGRVLAVLRGSAVNQDGRSNGLTAPNGTAQVAVIRAALDRAGVEPARVGYVEAHGSGTRLGDSIEMDGLQEVFGPGRAAPLVVGAVKTNVGHLLGAAGVAGLIKAVLALDRGVVPANLHHVRPNPAIGWGRCPVLLPTGPTPWPAGAEPRVAGVSSFGWSGTNAHVVLEQAPPERPTAPRPGPRLLTVSGRDADGLAETARRLSAEVAAGRADLADLAFTTQVGRAALEHRAALLVHDRDEAATALTALADAPPDHHVPPGHHPATALLLPGQGDHHAGMGRGLHATRPAFRAALDECVRLCRELRDLDPAPLLFAERGHHDLFARDAAGDTTPVDVVHAAVFAVDYACARLWDELGVRADALLGYSLGEYVAACLSGVFTLPDALALVVDRARLVATAPPGAMLAVALPEDQVADRLTAELSVAAVDGPGLTVVAGPEHAVAAVASRLAAERVAHRRVAASRAMHSASLAPLRSRLADLVAAVPRGEPTVPFLSNATGTWITADQARDPAYWADHLCLPVRFGPAVELLAAEGFGVLLEAGPGRGLSSLATQVLFAAGRTGVVAAPTLPAAGEDRPDAEVLLDTAGGLWSRGVPVDRSRLDPDPTRRTTSLPTYPFRHTAFWPEPVAPGAAPTSGARPVPGVRAGKAPDPADWCHVPTWRQVPVRAGRVGDGPWLVFADPLGVAATVAERLRAEGAEVFTAHPGDGFRQLD